MALLDKFKGFKFSNLKEYLLPMLASSVFVGYTEAHMEGSWDS